jgi:hypothetical protein
VTSFRRQNASFYRVIDLKKVPCYTAPAHKVDYLKSSLIEINEIEIQENYAKRACVIFPPNAQ